MADAKREAGRGGQAILKAARRVFLSQGYRASLDDVALAAGVTRRTLYNNFKNKEDLFRAVLKDVNQEMGLSTGQKPGEGPLREVLTKYATVYVDLLLEPDNLSLYRMIIENEVFPDLPPRIFEESIAPTMQALEQYFLEKMATGSVRVMNTRLLAEQFLSLVLGYARTKALMRVRDVASEDRRAYIDQAVDIFLRGISA